jgi:hypothetical protein
MIHHLFNHFAAVTDTKLLNKNVFIVTLRFSLHFELVLFQRSTTVLRQPKIVSQVIAAQFNHCFASRLISG